VNSEHLPLILIEGILIGGGALLFGWWQLRSVRRDREKAAAERAQRSKAETRSADDTGNSLP
jgi:hypothetical protein